MISSPNILCPKEKNSTTQINSTTWCCFAQSLTEFWLDLSRFSSSWSSSLSSWLPRFSPLWSSVWAGLPHHGHHHYHHDYQASHHCDHLLRTTGLSLGLSKPSSPTNESHLDKEVTWVNTTLKTKNRGKKQFEQTGHFCGDIENTCGKQKNEDTRVTKNMRN